MFTVIDCGFVPRCALEDSDSGETRIEKLYRIIGECGHGIHDISRTQPNEQGLPRFNMPLELGIFLGARRYGKGSQAKKRCLILDAERFRYQEFCSDLAGQDPKAHANDPGKAVVVVRDWLRDARSDSALPGGQAIFDRYRVFDEKLPFLCAERSLDDRELTFNDLTTLMAAWLEANPRATHVPARRKRRARG